MLVPDPIRAKNFETLAVISNNNDINTLRKKIDSFGVEVIFPKELENDVNSIICCYAILNLLPRFITTVRYTGPTSILKDFPPSHISKINLGEGVWNSSVTIVFGKNTKPNSQNVLYIGSAGWSSYISTKKPCEWNPLPVNSLSALYTAGLVVGEVFKRLLPEIPSEKISHFEYDLITHGTEKQPVVEHPVPETIHFEDLTLVGCGAVGQALVFALKGITRFWGSVSFVDADKLEPSNEQRYIGAFEENRGVQKTEIISQWFAQFNPGIATFRAPMKYEEYAKLSKPLGEEVISAVDNEKTRINIQAGLPKVQWNVWTDTSQNTLRYGAGYHTIGGPYQCAACGYFPTMGTPSQMEMNAIRTGFTKEDIEKRLASNDTVTEQDTLQVAKNTGAPIANLKEIVGRPFEELLHGDCGVFRLEFHEAPAVAPAPHASFLAGVFLAVQIVLRKMKLPSSAKLMESIADFDALGIPNVNCLMKKQKHPKCFCNDPVYQDSYNKKWNITK